MEEKQERRIEDRVEFLVDRAVEAALIDLMGVRAEFTKANALSNSQVEIGLLMRSHNKRSNPSTPFSHLKIPASTHSY